jgi:hypothetical protein
MGLENAKVGLMVAVEVNAGRQESALDYREIGR